MKTGGRRVPLNRGISWAWTASASLCRSHSLRQTQTAPLGARDVPGADFEMKNGFWIWRNIWCNASRIGESGGLLLLAHGALLVGHVFLETSAQMFSLQCCIIDTLIQKYQTKQCLKTLYFLTWAFSQSSKIVRLDLCAFWENTSAAHPFTSCCRRIWRLWPVSRASLRERFLSFFITRM